MCVKSVMRARAVFVVMTWSEQRWPRERTNDENDENDEENRLDSCRHDHVIFLVQGGAKMVFICV